MKKLIIALAFIASTVVAMAQDGTVNFNNRVIGDATATPPIPDIISPIFNVDGSTPLSGSGFLAQLTFRPAGSSGAFVAAGDALIFRTGTRAGFVDTAAGSDRTLTGIAAGANVDIQILAWDASKGATYAAAKAAFGNIGESPILSNLKTGGAGSPPGLSANLIGLQSFSLHPSVPEPTTIALGLLGAGALFLRRRK